MAQDYFTVEEAIQITKRNIPRGAQLSFYVGMKGTEQVLTFKRSEYTVTGYRNCDNVEPIVYFNTRTNIDSALKSISKFTKHLFKHKKDKTRVDFDVQD